MRSPVVRALVTAIMAMMPLVAACGNGEPESATPPSGASTPQPPDTRPIVDFTDKCLARAGWVIPEFDYQAGSVPDGLPMNEGIAPRFPQIDLLGASMEVDDALLTGSIDVVGGLASLDTSEPLAGGTEDDRPRFSIHLWPENSPPDEGLEIQVGFAAGGVEVRLVPGQGEPVEPAVDVEVTDESIVFSFSASELPALSAADLQMVVTASIDTVRSEPGVVSVTDECPQGALTGDAD